MRRVVIGTEVGAALTPGFGALHELRRPRFRLRVATPYRWVGLGALAILAISALGHIH